MSGVPDYLDFDLELAPAADGAYTARVLDSPKGEATATVRMPAAGADLENVILKLGRTRSGVRSLGSPQQQLAQSFGTQLYDAVFAGEVGTCFRRSLDQAEAQGKGLRIKLRLTDVPALGDVPWEYLYASGLGRFVVLSGQTPLVRYLDLPREVPPLTVSPPLRILLAVCSPTNLAKLDTDAEVAKVTAALGGLIDRGVVIVDPLPHATLSDLRAALRRNDYHILHFIGHGGFDPVAGDGVLAFEDPAHLGHMVSGGNLGTLLHDFRTLRLAVLNACEGARQSPTDPFSGVAQALVRQGLPAVVAMQFEITDEAATHFSQDFYSSLADGYPIDAALAQARLGVFSSDNDVEWGTPVLYLRARDGRIFDVPAVSTPSPRSTAATEVPAAPAPATEAAGPAPAPLPVTSPTAPVPTAYPPASPVPAAPASAPPAAPAPAAPPAPAPAAPPAPPSAPAPAAPPASGRSRGAVVAAGVLALAAAGTYAVLNRPDSPPAPPAPEATVVATATPSTPPVVLRTPEFVATKGTAVVDGAVGEWAAARTYTVAARVYADAAYPAGTAVSATFRLMWDADALYVLADVADATLTPADQAEPPKRFQGDSVSFELGPDARSLDPGKDFVRSADGHYLFGLLPAPGMATVVVNRPGADPRSGFTQGALEPGSEAWVAEIAGGYRIEARVPWSVTRISGPFAAGRVLGFNLNVSDRIPGTIKYAMFSSNPTRGAGDKQRLPGNWQAVQLG